MTSIDASGLTRLAADMGRAGVKVIPLAAAVVAKTAHDIETDAKAAAPVDTGQLRNSISSDVRALTAEVGPTAFYGHMIEDGTSRTGPRPYMGPAADAHADAFEQGIADAVKRLL